MKSKKHQNVMREGKFHVRGNTGSRHHQINRDEGKKFFKISEGQTFQESKLCNRNLIKDINTKAMSLVKYSGPFINWTREELRQMDHRTRKLMTIHIRDNINTLYVPRKGGRGYDSIKDCIDATRTV